MRSACCASVTLCIVHFLSSLRCQTDYLFCYISINVILLLKTSCLALLFFFLFLCKEIFRFCLFVSIYRHFGHVDHFLTVDVVSHNERCVDALCRVSGLLSVIHMTLSENINTYLWSTLFLYSRLALCDSLTYVIIDWQLAHAWSALITWIMTATDEGSRSSISHQHH